MEQCSKSNRILKPAYRKFKEKDLSIKSETHEDGRRFEETNNYVCHSNKEKDVFKSIANNDTVKEKRAPSFIQKTLGLKGKIRKRKKAAKILGSKNYIEKFFLRDDVSRSTAGKRECRTLHKTKKQIRYLNNSLKCLYDKFKQEGNLARSHFLRFAGINHFSFYHPLLKIETLFCVKNIATLTLNFMV